MSFFIFGVQSCLLLILGGCWKCLPPRLPVLSVTSAEAGASKDDVGGVGGSLSAVLPRRERGILVNSTVKTIMFWVFILICLMLLWGVVQRGTSMGKDTEIPYSDLYAKVEQ